MSFGTISMMIHDRRTAPIRQATSKILGGTALTFAMLLGFVNPSWALQVSPSALTFSATSGGTDPLPQTVVLSSSREREKVDGYRNRSLDHSLTFIGYHRPRNRHRFGESDHSRPRRRILFSKCHDHRDQSEWTDQKNNPPSDAVGHRNRCGTCDSTQPE